MLRFAIALLALAITTAGCTSVARAPYTGSISGPDARHYIASADFQPAAPGQWHSPQRNAPFPFDELIYSWQVSLPENEGFRLYLRVAFPEEEYSEWLYAGYWGEIPLNTETRRRNPSFPDGRIALDQLLLNRHAHRYQFKLVDEGASPLSTLPALHVITTDNDIVNEIAGTHLPMPTRHVPILDLPYRAQADSHGNRMPDRCQSAAIATALQYYGQVHHLEKLVPMIYDDEYRYPGIWPRTLAAATQLGFDGYIDRFRDWESVARALEQNKVILVSMTMPASLEYIAPPYASIGGHIIALNGITPDGRVIVTDSAMRPETGTRCQWLKEDFEKIWFEQKGGVGMVIVPPRGAPTRTITDLPPFPGDRRKPTGDTES